MDTPVRPVVWLLLARLDDPLVPAVLPCAAWMAAEAGALIECYLESPRSGGLFAPSGALVVSGQHHQAWNYLHARADVRYIVLGDPQLFASSLPLMGRVLVQAERAGEIYRTLLAQPGVGSPSGLALIPAADVTTADGPWDGATYLHPDLCLGRRLAFTDADEATQWEHADRQSFLVAPPAGWRAGETLAAHDTSASVTTRIAARWQDRHGGVAFGDPLAIRAQLAWHCRHRRVSFWGRKQGMPRGEVQISDYVEDRSSANAAAGAAAAGCEPPLITGRQTCDGDLMAWSRLGVAMEITDPCRPVLPVVDALPHPWRPSPAPTPSSDAQLAQWADERRELACLVVHSGEIAHNEAMLALCELAERHGTALGLGACVGRYRTCPQQWELIATARESGGFRGLVEPLLYGNGWGIMAEALAPPQRLADALRSSLVEIRRIAGPAGTPSGHYSFLDTDLATLGPPPAALHAAYAAAGLAFDIGSARPGRCRLLHRQPGFVALNQTCRTVHNGSPYVRIQDPEDLGTHIGGGPGWLIAALDAPVVGFAPAIWERGSRIAELFRQIGRGRIAATPSTIARYARLLAERRLLPVDREGAA